MFLFQSTFQIILCSLQSIFAVASDLQAKGAKLARFAGLTAPLKSSLAVPQGIVSLDDLWNSLPTTPIDPAVRSGYVVYWKKRNVGLFTFLQF
jgi:hypothetical protein